MTMIDPNRGASADVLAQHKAQSYERFRLELFEAIKSLLKDFDMTWDDLAMQVLFPNGTRYMTGVELRQRVGSEEIGLSEVNAIAHVFSAEPQVIFRPRAPWTDS